MKVIKKSEEAYCVVEDKDGKLYIEWGNVDVFDDFEREGRVEVPIVGELYNLSNFDVVEKQCEFVKEYFVAVADRRINTVAQRMLWNELCKHKLVEETLEEYCKNTACMCPLIFSIGCVSLYKSEDITKSKLWTQLESACSLVYTPLVIRRIRSIASISVPAPFELSKSRGDDKIKE